MAKAKEPFNPFYALVILVGVAFAVTAFVYGTMTYRAAAPEAAERDAEHGLMILVDRYGVRALGIELGLLAAATFGAMWLDGVRTRQSQEQDSDSQRNPLP